MTEAPAANNSSSNNGTFLFAPPSHVLSDYIEIGLMLLFYALGFPINTNEALRLWRLFRAAKMSRVRRQGVLKRRDAKGSLTASSALLQLQLTISILLVLWTVCVPKAYWLVTYDWRLGGRLSCKALHAVWLFVHALSSNCVAAIALDRAVVVSAICSTSKTKGFLKSSRVSRFTRLTVFGCWLLSLLYSLPQLVIFNTIELPMADGETFLQCTSQWRIDAFFGRTTPWTLLFSETHYGVFHVLTVFWLPLATMAASYAFIATKLAVYTLRFESNKCRRPPPQPAAERSRLLRWTNGHTASEQQQHSEFDVVSVLAVSEASPDRTPVGSSKTSAYSAYETTSVGVSSSLAAGRDSLRKRWPRGGLKKKTKNKTATWRRQMSSQTSKRATAIVLLYTLCWLPYNLTVIVLLIDRGLSNMLDDKVHWFHCLIYVNMLLNPFLYRPPGDDEDKKKKKKKEQPQLSATASGLDDAQSLV